jgi:aminoglycoside phosphotransferase (APT) family kinase protein
VTNPASTSADHDLRRDDPPGIDAATLTPWLEANVDGLRGPCRYELVAGGHSCLTFVVTDVDGRRVVLRRPPLGHVLATAHDVVREHRIIAALGPTDVPVAPALAVCDDETVNGAPFFVMDFVDGRVAHTADDVDAVLPDAASREAATWSLVDALAALHRVDVDAVGLGDLSRRHGYLDRQLKRWATQWEASRTRELPLMERMHAWLVEHRPADPPATIVHGDFRLGNLLLAPSGQVLAVLDWELCTLGDPMADVAYLLRSWVAPEEPGGRHLEPPTRAGGFPSREQVVERYRAVAGRAVDDLGYWMAFNAWRSAAIAEGVLRRYLDGAMGTRPDDLDAFARSVEDGARAAATSAGLDPD